MSHLSFNWNQIKLEMLTISHYFSFWNTHNFPWSSLSSNNCQSNLRFHSFLQFYGKSRNTVKWKHIQFSYISIYLFAIETYFHFTYMNTLLSLSILIFLVFLRSLICFMPVGSLPDRHLLPDLRGGVHQLAGEDHPHSESQLSLAPQFYLSLHCIASSYSEKLSGAEINNWNFSLLSRIKIQNSKIFNPIPAEFRCRYHQSLVLSSEIIGNWGLPGVHVRDGNYR